MIAITYEDIKYIKSRIKKTLIIKKSKRAHHFKEQLKKQFIKCALPYPTDFRFYSIEHICQYGSILNYILKRRVRDKHQKDGYRTRGYIAEESDA